MKFFGSNEAVADRPGSKSSGMFAARCAAPATSAKESVLPAALNLPSAKPTSEAPSRCPARRFILSRTRSSALSNAGPPTAMLRLPKVPMPYCTSAVSPWRTEMSSRATPRKSAAICAKLVSSPCPCGEQPVSTVTLPDGSTRTDALSQPPAGTAGEGPRPQIST